MAAGQERKESTESEGSGCIGMEGFWVQVLEWNGSGLNWNGRGLAPALEWNGRVLAACSGMEGFLLPALEWKGFG